MKVNLAAFRTIVLLVDEQKNIVIFPISKSDFPIEFADGSFEEFGYLPAYYPIELKYPYDTKDLAKKIVTIEHRGTVLLCDNTTEPSPWGTKV